MQIVMGVKKAWEIRSSCCKKPESYFSSVWGPDCSELLLANLEADLFPACIETNEDQISPEDPFLFNKCGIL